MSVDPKLAEAMTKRIAERRSEELQGLMRKALTDGFAFFSRGKPAERLKGYMAATMVEELPMILDPEYKQKNFAGVYPLPFQPCNAQVIDPITGMQGYCRQPIGHEGPIVDPMLAGHTPDAPTPLTNMWALVAALPWWPDWSPWKYLTDDLARLLEREVLALSVQMSERQQGDVQL